MILSLSNLSVSAANWCLGMSEICLLVSAVVLTLGLIGEWPDSESWKKRKLYKFAKLAVVAGVVGELIGDAGIFETSARLTVLQQTAIEQANTKAANAILDAAAANERAVHLAIDAGELRIKAAEAETRLDFLRKKIGSRQIDEKIFLRELKEKRKPEKVSILYAQNAQDGWYLATQFEKLFIEAGWPCEPRKEVAPETLYPEYTPMVALGEIGSGIVIRFAPNPPDFGKDDWAFPALSRAIFKTLGQTGGKGGAD
jgi:hypothetical protein